MRYFLWRIRLWYLRQLLSEASQMTRAHWNICRNDIDDHMKKRPRT